MPDAFLQIFAAILWIPYFSLYEWWMHKYLMHRPKPLPRAFRGHTLEHHKIYRGDGTFHTSDTGNPGDVTIVWFVFPLLLGLHMPFFYLVERWLFPHSFIGATVMGALYYAGYEYTHWMMHVPKDRWLERLRFFRFIKNHHRLHHRYMYKNFNVFLPLCDWILGTLIVRDPRATSA